MNEGKGEIATERKNDDLYFYPVHNIHLEYIIGIKNLSKDGWPQGLELAEKIAFFFF